MQIKICLAVFMIFGLSGFCTSATREALDNAIRLLEESRDLAEADDVRTPIKCGTFILNPLREGGPGIDPALTLSVQRRFFAKAASLPESEMILSPSGRFKVYFTRTGTHAVRSLDKAALLSDGSMVQGADGIPDYPQWVASICDSVFTFLGTGLGYRLPAGTVVAQLYDLRDDNNEYYGFAYPWGDTIDFDNDMGFFGPETTDIRALYAVTAAHELFHLVQFQYTTVYNFFNEPSAVWMEEKLYPAVDDYLHYLRSSSSSNIFKTPNAPLDANGSGGDYNRVVWPLFLDQRYGADVIRTIWELYARPPAGGTPVILDSAIRQSDGTQNLARAFAEFSRWMFHTGPLRGTLTPAFTDALLWPEIFMDTVDFIRSPFSVKSFPVSPLGLDYRLLKNRRSMNLGFTLLNNQGATGVFVEVPAYLPPRFIYDTAFVAGGVFQFVPAWTNPAGRPEIVGLANAGNDSIRAGILSNDSIYFYTTEDTLFKAFTPGDRARLSFLDTLFCPLKDSAGQPDTAGWNTITAAENCGITVTTPVLTSGLQNRLNPHAGNQLIHALYQVTTDSFPRIENLLDSAKVRLDFIFSDSSDSYLAYSVQAVDTAAARAVRFAAASGAPGHLTLDYRTARNAFRKSTRNGRTFLLLICRSRSIAVKTFPNPVLTGPVHIAYLRQDPGGFCRIHTLSGHLVRNLSESTPSENRLVQQVVSSYSEDGPLYQRAYLWDLKNEAGRRAAPGIYLYYVLDNLGAIRADGKIAVLPNP